MRAITDKKQREDKWLGNNGINMLFKLITLNQSDERKHIQKIYHTFEISSNIFYSS